MSLPASVPEPITEEFLGVFGKILLQTRVKEGKMTCPSCLAAYPIANGIPNMLGDE